MSQRLSSLFSDFTGNNNPTDESRVFLARPFSADKSITLVHHSGQPLDSPSSYHLRTTKRNLSYFRGSPGHCVQIGDAKIHKWSSSSADIRLHGHPLTMKVSSSSGHTTYQSPTMGKLKWKTADSLTGSGLVLVDSHGTKIARTSTQRSLRSLAGAKRIEILLDPGQIQAEEILFAAVCAKGVNKAAGEAANSILEAIGGM